jgi:hypothetical protein
LKASPLVALTQTTAVADSGSELGEIGRYECGSTIVTSNLPFEEWTGVFGSERLTHHVQTLELNGESAA